MEKFLSVFPAKLDCTFLLCYSQAKSLLDYRSKFVHRRHLLLQIDYLLSPVAVFAESNLFKQSIVVRIVVEAGERTELVVPFDEQPFLVHIGKSPRPFDTDATTLFAPCLNGSDEGFEHFCIFYEIEPSETDYAGLPGIVGLVVDNGGDAPCNLAIFVCEIPVCFAIIVSTVFCRIKSIVFIPLKGGDQVFKILIEFRITIHKFSIFA